MSPRVYIRKFDWDEARRRVAAGESKSSVARSLGVSPSAVHLAVDDAARARQTGQRLVWVHQGRCIDCGTKVTRIRKDDIRRCNPCSAKAQSKTSRDGMLLCSDCREWKPDEAFGVVTTKSTIARRGRRLQCRSCDTKRRQDYRDRNRESEQAYWRLYAKRRRAKT